MMYRSMHFSNPISILFRGGRGVRHETAVGFECIRNATGTLRFLSRLCFLMLSLLRKQPSDRLAMFTKKKKKTVPCGATAEHTLGTHHNKVVSFTEKLIKASLLMALLFQS